MRKNVKTKTKQSETFATSFRLSAEGQRLLERLAEDYGMSRASVIELLIRLAAGRVQIPISPEIIREQIFNEQEIYR